MSPTRGGGPVDSLARGGPGLQIPRSSSDPARGGHTIERRTSDERPHFLITIDTEGDNLWANPKTITTRNAAYLPRFQALCERHGLRPTYLTNYEMARSPQFCELARDVLSRGAGEIGMHLHAWNNPPLEPITADDFAHNPYLTEYPEAAMRRKIDVLTDLLEETFGCKMLSHRGGRWAFDARYARMLVERGYRVDCSVTPCISWQRHRGHPDGLGGPDYSRFPDRAYFLDLDDIRRPGTSPLLEVPVTIVTLGALARHVQRWLGGVEIVRRVLSRRWLHWLRPNGRNLPAMLEILRLARADGRDYVEFALHSSELMAGGSPNFGSEAEIEKLYEDLEALFEAAAGEFEGATMGEYRERVERRSGA